jgi:hypothetical protein
MIKPGSFYVGDRLYSEHHLQLKQLQKAGVDLVVRLKGNVVRTPQTAPALLSAEDRQAGVVADRVEELGGLGAGRCCESWKSTPKARCCCWPPRGGICPPP